MKKIAKILLIIFILLFTCTYIGCVYASNVNMNLSNSDSTTYGSTTTTNTSSASSSVVVSSETTTSALESLTMSDMINIVLCAIGVILILLGIAIIIRQKS